MTYPLRVFLLRLLITFAAIWLSAIAMVDGYGQLDRARPADVIVVLGAQVRGGQPGPSLTRRTRHGVQLFQVGLASRFLCTGGLGTVPPTEARAACDLAQSLGVPASAIVLEEQAHSTEESALYTAAILRERGWTSAIVVTDAYHLFRTVLLFQSAGVAAFPFPAQATAGPMHPIEQVFRTHRELAALAWYWGKTALGITATDFDLLVK